MATTLTFVPGLMSDRRVWEPVWAELGDRFGISYLPVETERTLAGMLGLFEAAASEGPLNLIGHSMGGYLSMRFAFDHPKAVRSLTVICTSPYGLSDKEKADRAAAITWLSKQPYTGVTTHRLNQFIHPSRQSDASITGVIRAMDRDLGKDVLLAQLREATERGSPIDRLPQLSCPALFVAAEVDPFAPAEHLRKAHEVTPGSRFVEGKGMGHMIPLERPDWLAARITEFIDSIR